MLFTILIGVVTTLSVSFLQKLFIRLKFLLNGGKADRIGNEPRPYLIFSATANGTGTFLNRLRTNLKRGKHPWSTGRLPKTIPALKKPYSFVKCTFIGNLNQCLCKDST
jgi:hypothetical protein